MRVYNIINTMFRMYNVVPGLDPFRINRGKTGLSLDQIIEYFKNEKIEKKSVTIYVSENTPEEDKVKLEEKIRGTKISFGYKNFK